MTVEIIESLLHPTRFPVTPTPAAAAPKWPEADIATALQQAQAAVSTPVTPGDEGFAPVAAAVEGGLAAAVADVAGAWANVAGEKQAASSARGIAAMAGGVLAQLSDLAAGAPVPPPPPPPAHLPPVVQQAVRAAAECNAAVAAWEGLSARAGVLQRTLAAAHARLAARADVLRDAEARATTELDVKLDEKQRIDTALQDLAVETTASRLGLPPGDTTELPADVVMATYLDLVQYDKHEFGSLYAQRAGINDELLALEDAGFAARHGAAAAAALAGLVDVAGDGVAAVVLQVQGATQRALLNAAARLDAAACAAFLAAWSPAAGVDADADAARGVDATIHPHLTCLPLELRRVLCHRLTAITSAASRPAAATSLKSRPNLFLDLLSDAITAAVGAAGDTPPVAAAGTLWATAMAAQQARTATALAAARLHPPSPILAPPPPPGHDGPPPAEVQSSIRAWTRTLAAVDPGTTPSAHSLARPRALFGRPHLGATFAATAAISDPDPDAEAGTGARPPAQQRQAPRGSTAAAPNAKPPKRARGNESYGDYEFSSDEEADDDDDDDEDDDDEEGDAPTKPQEGGCVIQ